VLLRLVGKATEAVEERGHALAIVLIVQWTMLRIHLEVDNACKRS
jgi:hypothetical protein